MRRTLTVAEALSEVRGKVRQAPPKTSAARRQLALPKFLADELTGHPVVTGSCSQLPRVARCCGCNFRRRTWLPAVMASVGERMRFHDLRHSHAAMLIAQGEHPKDIQNRLGHSSIKVTLDTYGHLFEGLDETAAERLDAAFPQTSPNSSRTPGRNTVVEINS